MREWCVHANGSRGGDGEHEYWPARKWLNSASRQLNPRLQPNLQLKPATVYLDCNSVRLSCNPTCLGCSSHRCRRAAAARNAAVPGGECATARLFAVMVATGTHEKTELHRRLADAQLLLFSTAARSMARDEPIKGVKSRILNGARHYGFIYGSPLTIEIAGGSCVYFDAIFLRGA